MLCGVVICNRVVVAKNTNINDIVGFPRVMPGCVLIRYSLCTERYPAISGLAQRSYMFCPVEMNPPASPPL